MPGGTSHAAKNSRPATLAASKPRHLSAPLLETPQLSITVYCLYFRFDAFSYELCQILCFRIAVKFPGSDGPLPVQLLEKPPSLRHIVTNAHHFVTRIARRL